MTTICASEARSFLQGRRPGPSGSSRTGATRVQGMPPFVGQGGQEHGIAFHHLARARHLAGW